MSNQARILIADDEETFAHATADLLRREGHICEVAPDAAGARTALCSGDFDLLIADIRMPGNEHLEFLREVPALAPGLPVIVVTAFPSVASAVAAVDLPVVGYLMKPLDVTALLERVHAAVSRRRAIHAVEAVRARLQSWLADLDRVEEGMRVSPRDPTVPASTSLTTLTLTQVTGTLNDLRTMLGTAGQTAVPDVCAILGCARRLETLALLRETIEVLQQTKHAFKSKELGALRKKLEQAVAGAAA